ncbi:MAG: translation elongation factor Ts [Candidatus Aminicenantaceae bacterium]
MKITAQMVNELRQCTGIGMMECKKALQETEGDIKKAINVLRTKGMARAKEKMSRSTSDGMVGSYIHMNGRLGVLVEINCESDFVSRNEEFQELVKNVAMHIAAANPTYVSADQVPAESLQEEKDIIRTQFKDSDKPKEIVEKIVEGKLGKFFSEVCLLNQPYIKDDKMTVEQLLATYIAKFGENIQVKQFARFALGES